MLLAWNSLLLEFCGKTFRQSRYFQGIFPWRIFLFLHESFPACFSKVSFQTTFWQSSYKKWLWSARGLSLSIDELAIGMSRENWTFAVILTGTRQSFRSIDVLQPKLQLLVGDHIIVHEKSLYCDPVWWSIRRWSEFCPLDDSDDYVVFFFFHYFADLSGQTAIVKL